MLSLKVFDKTNLHGVRKALEKAAEVGVEAATQEAVEWIKDDVIAGQQYVGHEYYPDVTPATKRMKAKRGKEKVLIDTSNYLSSWDGEAKGLKGKITGGGGASARYSGKLYERGWQIDKLYMAEHAKVSEKIIEETISRAT